MLYATAARFYCFWELDVPREQILRRRSPRSQYSLKYVSPRDIRDAIVPIKLLPRLKTSPYRETFYVLHALNIDFASGAGYRISIY